MAERDNLPRWRDRRGRYEAWFLTMSAPDGRTGYWIRYAIRSPVAGPVEPRVWFARFRRDDPEATFGVSIPAEGVRAASDRFEVHLGEAVLRSGHASGSVAGAGRRARWDLEFETGEPSFRFFPAPLYRDGVVPTRPLTPNPSVRYRGSIEVDGEVTHLNGFPGQQGHVEGTRHGERWAWAACSSFDEEDVVFQGLCAQGGRGPIATPHLSFAGLRVGGRWLRFRGGSRNRPWSLGRWRFRLAGDGHRLEGEVSVSPTEMVQARYLDPDDAPRWCHHSDVASCRLVLWERGPGGWRQALRLASDGTTQAEWAGRTPAPSVGNRHVEVA